ncbi:YolD-like family protein [Metabacillus sp. Hm71]|uniref:YolD-like family protein n=1 Tax=Metabacillus sp. Hm71 TaxID=3450743 RepID=UPI003F442C96
MIRDRGTKKWTSLMLPEHVKLMKEAWRDFNKESKPILDEHEIEVMESKICYSMEHRLEIEITTWCDGFTEVLCGYVHYIDPITKELRIVNKESTIRLKFDEIIKLNVID